MSESPIQAFTRRAAGNYTADERRRRRLDETVEALVRFHGPHEWSDEDVSFMCDMVWEALEATDGPSS
jgi:hypothetical protein